MSTEPTFCASSPEAAAMSDGEFWSNVYADRGDMESEQAPAIDDDLAQRLASPCMECGATGACAWDSEGRPLIHPLKADQ